MGNKIGKVSSYECVERGRGGGSLLACALGGSLACALARASLPGGIARQLPIVLEQGGHCLAGDRGGFGWEAVS